MPLVNPDTNEPMSDDPNASDDLRGGKKLGDPGLADATEQGRGGHRVHPEDEGGVLPGEKPAVGSVERP